MHLLVAQGSSVTQRSLQWYARATNLVGELERDELAPTDDGFNSRFARQQFGPDAVHQVMQRVGQLVTEAVFELTR